MRQRPVHNACRCAWAERRSDSSSRRNLRRLFFSVLSFACPQVSATTGWRSNVPQGKRPEFSDNYPRATPLALSAGKGTVTRNKSVFFTGDWLSQSVPPSAVSPAAVYPRRIRLPGVFFACGGRIASRKALRSSPAPATAAPRTGQSPWGRASSLNGGPREWPRNNWRHR